MSLKLILNYEKYMLYGCEYQLLLQTKLRHKKRPLRATGECDHRKTGGDLCGRPVFSSARTSVEMFTLIMILMV